VLAHGQNGSVKLVTAAGLAPAVTWRPRMLLLHYTVLPRLVWEREPGSWFLWRRGMAIPWTLPPRRRFALSGRLFSHESELAAEPAGRGKREIKRAGMLSHSRPVLFQQRTNTSCYLAIPTRGFTAAVSVFGAHLLRSPSVVKSVLRSLTTRSSFDGHTTSVRIQCSSSPNSVCRRKTSPGCRASLNHSFFAFR
jgi:hypothetical protein